MLSKSKLIATTAILCSALAVPAMAQTNNAANNTAAASTSELTAARNVVDNAANSLKEMKSNADFTKLLHQAKGVFIVPEFAKGAVVVGGSGGTGVLVVKKNGTWSDPAFFTIGSISIGAQAGGKAGPIAMFLMTNKAVNDFTQSSNFSLNGNAGLTIVEWSPQGQGSIGKGDVVVWSGTSGLFAGLSVSGSDITADAKEDQAFYRSKQAGTKQIIDNQVASTSPSTAKLHRALPS